MRQSLLFGPDAVIGAAATQAFAMLGDSSSMAAFLLSMHAPLVSYSQLHEGVLL